MKGRNKAAAKVAEKKLSRIDWVEAKKSEERKFVGMNLIGPKTVVLKDVKTSFFTRINVNEERVHTLADLYESKVDVKPIIIAEKDYELIDGRHRLEALRRIGLDSTKAFLAKTSGRVENIIESVKANLGGSLPPSQEDFEHSIELLINQGVNKGAILKAFPLPQAVTGKYYKLVMNQIYKRKIRQACEAVVRRNMPINEAAVKYAVAPEDLKALIQGNIAKKGSSLQSLTGSIETKVRSLSGSIHKSHVSIITMFNEGELDATDVKEFQRRIKQSAKSVERNIGNINERLSVLLNGDAPKEEEEDE